MTTKASNPETAINQGMEQMKAEELSRILRAGYPTIEFHEPEGDSAGRITWWRDDERENDLTAAYNKALDNLGSDWWQDGNRDTDSPAAVEMHKAGKRYWAYQDEIVTRTLDAIRTQGNLEDLCRLIDSAAEQGQASCCETTAGYFLRRIAELALSALKPEEAPKPKSSEFPHPKTIAIFTACLHAQMIALDNLMNQLLVSNDDEREQRFVKMHEAMTSLPTVSPRPRFIDFPDAMNATAAWLADHLPSNAAAEQIGALEYAIAHQIGLFGCNSIHPDDDEPGDIFS